MPRTFAAVRGVATLVANAETVIADFPYTSAVPTPPDFTHAGQPYFADGFAPPPDHLRVFPHTLIPSESKKIFAIPVPAGRSPMITIGQSTDYATFITSAPNHGFYSSHKSRHIRLPVYSGLQSMAGGRRATLGDTNRGEGTGEHASRPAHALHARLLLCTAWPVPRHPMLTFVLCVAQCCLHERSDSYEMCAVAARMCSA